MMKFLVHIARFIVGVTFVFSGFVKLVDPLGSAYKFQEYFSPEVLNLDFLSPYALPFSIILILIEIMLGVMLIIGYLPKFTAWSLLILILVFLYLTWYSAYYDKVTDCGCFGDAIKLDSWDTFYKNIVLTILIIILLIRNYDIFSIFSESMDKWLTFLFFVSFLYITYHVLTHLPLIDFRPYAVGNNIIDGMQYKEGQDFPDIHDFSLETEDSDLTEELLAADKVMLVIAYSIDKSDVKGFEKIKPVVDKAFENNYRVYAVSASLPEDFDIINKENNLNLDVLFCDETTLKTIVRANPGILTIEKGVITGKRSWQDAHKIKLK